MARYRYSLRTLILWLTLVAVYFPLAQLYDSWFASKYGQYYISNVLGFKIRNGDTFNRVASFFGSSQLVGPDHQLGMMSIKELCASNNWPIEEDDQFYRFSIRGGSAVYLQFRDNRLINLKNSTYTDASLLASMGGYSLPHPALTLGFLPLYAIIVPNLVFLSSLFRRSRQSQTPNTEQSDPRELGAGGA